MSLDRDWDELSAVMGIVHEGGATSSEALVAYFMGDGPDPLAQSELMPAEVTWLRALEGGA